MPSIFINTSTRRLFADKECKQPLTIQSLIPTSGATMPLDIYALDANGPTTLSSPTASIASTSKPASGVFELSYAATSLGQISINASISEIAAYFNSNSTIAGIGGVDVVGSVGGWVVRTKVKGVTGAVAVVRSDLDPFGRMVVTETQAGSATQCAVWHVRGEYGSIALANSFSQSTPASVAVTEKLAGGASDYEVQRITFTGEIYSGHYVIGTASGSTAPIKIGASASAVESAINSVIGAGSVKVSVCSKSEMEVAWQAVGTRAALTVTATGLTGIQKSSGTLTLATTEAASFPGELATFQVTSGSEVIYEETINISAINSDGAVTTVAFTEYATDAELAAEVATLNAAIALKVTGPASATDGVPALFDGTTGKLLKNSTPTGTGAVVRGTSPNITTPTGIVKGDIGLGNVDNTTDLNKPISTATQTALDAKVTGPASATDNAIARFDGTTGKLLQNSAATINDDGAIETNGADAYIETSGLYAYITTNGQYAYIVTNGANASISTNGANAIISTNGANAAISTNGANAAISTIGANAAISTTGAEASISTSGVDAYISTNGTNAYIQTRSSFKLTNGTYITTIDHAPTDERTATLPDKTGTLAMTSDITVKELEKTLYPLIPSAPLDHFDDANLSADWTLKGMVAGDFSKSSATWAKFDLGTATGAAVQRTIHRAWAATTNATLTLRCQYNSLGHGHPMIGPCFTNDSGNGIAFAGYSSGGTSVLGITLVDWYYSTTPLTVSLTQDFSTEQRPYWLRLRKAGTTYYFSYSLCGRVWTPETSGVVNATAMTRVGAGMFFRGAGTIYGSSFEIDYFDIT